MVWFRTGALPDFRKLWGVIDEDLDEGTYTMKISNQYSVDDFDGKKFFVLSTTNEFGGKNREFAIVFVVFGVIALFQAIVFCVIWKFRKVKELVPPNNYD
jgi:hypothetical protein